MPKSSRDEGASVGPGLLCRQTQMDVTSTCDHLVRRLSQRLRVRSACCNRRRLSHRLVVIHLISSQHRMATSMRNAALKLGPRRG